MCVCVRARAIIVLQLSNARLEAIWIVISKRRETNGVSFTIAQSHCLKNVSSLQHKEGEPMEEPELRVRGHRRMQEGRQLQRREHKRSAEVIPDQCTCLSKLPKAEKRTTQKDFRKQSFGSNWVQQQCLTPPSKLENILIYSILSRICRKVLPRQ